VPLTPKGAVPKQVEEETKMEPANLGSPENNRQNGYK